MKLKINGFENEFIFNDKNVNVLQIADSKCFSHIIDVLNQKINGLENSEIFLLDENEEELKIEKNMYLVVDLFNIEYNSKKILNKIYEEIDKNIQNSQGTEMNQMVVKLRNYLIQEINELPFEFIMKSDISIPEILKVYDVKIDKTNYATVLERVEILIDLLATLKIAQILVIPNLNTYLDEEELVELYKYSLYNNIKLLIIEKEHNKKLKYETILKIDETYNDEIL